MENKDKCGDFLLCVSEDGGLTRGLAERTSVHHNAKVGRENLPSVRGVSG